MSGIRHCFALLLATTRISFSLGSRCQADERIGCIDTARAASPFVPHCADATPARRARRRRRAHHRSARCGPKFMDKKSHSCSDPQCEVQAFDDSTARRSPAVASRGPRLGASRAGWRLRQSHHRLQKRSRVLSSAGDDSRPHHVFRPQNRGVVFSRCPRPIEGRIMPRFLRSPALGTC